MYGAILGDLAGSIYEYEQTKKIMPIKVDELIPEKAFFSDDTILTVAVLDAILNDRDYDNYLRKYIREYQTYKPNFSPYFKTSFSPGMMKWKDSNSIGTSKGNGAMMRISPVGFMFDKEDEVIENSYLATIPSHNSKEAISCATKIALVIFYLRQGLSVDETYKKLNIELKYTPFTKFNTTCRETIDNCLFALYYSKSLEDAIKKVILFGGDTDTNACIVGSMAEARYGISETMQDAIDKKIPNEFVKVLKKTNRYGRIN